MTPQDLKQIGDLLDQKLEEKLNQKFDEKLLGIKSDISGLKLDVSGIKSDIIVLKDGLKRNEKHIQSIEDSLVEWKLNVFDALDKFMSETTDQREFRLINGHQTVSNTNRIEKLEAKVFGSITTA